MAGTIKRFVTGVAAGAVILAFATWFDTTVTAGVQHESFASFDVTSYGLAFGVGSIVLSGLVLAVAAIGWRCRSIGLGIVYLVVGALFAFLVYLTLAVGLSIGSPDGPPPLLDLLSVLSNLQAWTEGPLHAFSVIGGAMAIVGVAQITEGLRKRRTNRGSPELPAEPAEPRATIEEVVGPAGG